MHHLGNAMGKESLSGLQLCAIAGSVGVGCRRQHASQESESAQLNDVATNSTMAGVHFLSIFCNALFSFCLLN